MDVLTYDDYKQKIHLDNLGFILLMPILIDFLSVIVQQFGMSGSSVITMALYGLSLIVIIIKLIKIVTVHEILNDIILYFLLVLYRFIRNGIQRVHLIYNVSHKVALIIFLSSAKIGKTILPTIDAGEKGGVLSVRSLRRRETGEWELLLKDKERYISFFGEMYLL